MRLTLLDKDRDSKSKACPSVYIADTGELVIQGAEVTGDDTSALQDPLPSETAVRISPEIILRAVEKYKRNGVS
ncbi:hypothetical protein FHX37_2173 [Haloactinospora alba]|uniref:Uncharacterized protein n=1 Tax=Haloactinospora alba TaxID=405555 RepID=A0A543NK29_9ACTN|nr:hypothetical protein [Haloactinospora alba]TQN32223.1 hypothetical protein FHX37_2173 [Haloactinospora alba]